MKTTIACNAAEDVLSERTRYTKQKQFKQKKMTQNTYTVGHTNTVKSTRLRRPRLSFWSTRESNDFSEHTTK
jgi:ABC-type transport system involved in cytochrome c biogenesis ATPase subunit